MKVLIADGSKAMQGIITKSLKDAGFDNMVISYADDGASALIKIQGEKPDLVLCDMHMPEKNGLDILKTVRHSGNLTKFFIVSIDDNEDLLRRIEKAGASGFLKKPFTSKQLVSLISPFTSSSTSNKEHKRDSNFWLSEYEELISSIQRILSGLSTSDIRFSKSEFTSIDYSQSPFYGGTFQDDQDRVALGVFLDVLAAGAIASIIGRRPLNEAHIGARNQKLDELSRQLCLAFLTIVCGLCKPSPNGKLLRIHREMFIENPDRQIKKNIDHSREFSFVFDLFCDTTFYGKAVFVFPPVNYGL